MEKSGNVQNALTIVYRLFSYGQNDVMLIIEEYPIARYAHVIVVALREQNLAFPRLIYATEIYLLLGCHIPLQLLTERQHS